MVFGVVKKAFNLCEEVADAWNSLCFLVLFHAQTLHFCHRMQSKMLQHITYISLSWNFQEHFLTK